MTTVRKTAAKRPARTLAAPVEQAPVGKWAKVLAEGQRTPGVAIEPFEVYAGLTLQPLTPRRATKLDATQVAYFTALAASANAQRFGASKDEVAEIQERVEEALGAYNEALIGEDEYPLVQEYFADRPAWMQELFLNEVRRQFLRLPDDDGTCQVCGHTPGALEKRIESLEAALRELDERHPVLGGELGKEVESSTTSSTTGKSS